jgi:hypothetical protein
MSDKASSPLMLSADGAKPSIAEDAELTDANSVLVFAIEHDDGTVFEKRIPNVARPNLTYGYLRRIRQVGQMEAEAWMMWKVLGDDGKNRVQKITNGGAQNPKA